MFLFAEKFNQNISNWDVSNVKNMLGMFSGATKFNQNISNWNVENVTNMGSMFLGATSFNQDISNWNVENVTNMRVMFYKATSFNQKLDWGNKLKTDVDMVNMFTDSEGSIKKQSTQSKEKNNNLVIYIY